MTAEEQADKIIEYSRAMPASARMMILEIIAEMNRAEKERDEWKEKAGKYQSLAEQHGQCADCEMDISVEGHADDCPRK